MVVFCALAFALSSQTATISPQAGITFTEFGAPTAKTIAELSKAAGVPLAVAPAMRYDTLVIAVKNQPLSVVLQKISDATLGQWKLENGVDVLTIDPRRQAEAENAVAQQKIEKAESLLNRPVATLLKNPDHEKLEEDVSDGRGGIVKSTTIFGQNSLATAEAAAHIGYSVLAGLAPMQRSVYATDPTAAQFPLSAEDAQAIISEFHKRYVPNDSYPDTSAAKVIVSLQSLRGFIPVNEYQVRASIFNDKGTEIYTTDEDIYDPFLHYSFPPLKDDTSPMVEMPKTAQAVFEPSLLTETITPEDAAKIRKEIQDPTSYDPLKPFGAIIAKVASANEMNCVASMPDNLGDGVRIFENLPTKFTANDFLRRLATVPTLVTSSGTGKWITIRSFDLESAKNAYETRSDLKQLVRLVLTPNTVSIDDMVRFQPLFLAPCTPLLNYLQAVAPKFTALFRLSRWDVIDLYHSLPIDVRSAKITSFAQLPPETLKQISSFVFDSDTHLTFSNKKVPVVTNPLSDAIQDIQSPTDGDTYDGESAILLEPTQSFPNGLSTSGYLSMSTEKIPLCSGVHDGVNNPNPYQTLPLYSLAALNAAGPNSPFVIPGFHAPTHFQMGTRTVIKITLHLSSTLEKSCQLSLDDVPPDAPVYTLATLPHDLLLQYKTELEKYNKLAGRTNSEGSNGIPTHP